MCAKVRTNTHLKPRSAVPYRCGTPRLDDRHADGVMAIANWSVPNALEELPRERVVSGDGSALADAAFALEPNQVVVVPFDEQASPLGWNVVLRTR